ncbi:MAG: hypothetical protein ABI416_05870 [Ginsengibacter sp.]
MLYNVGISDTLAAALTAIDKLAGVQFDEKNNDKKIEFFKKNNLLWIKNEAFGETPAYAGNNTFQYPAMPQGISSTFLFELMTG